MIEPGNGLHYDSYLGSPYQTEKNIEAVCSPLPQANSGQERFFSVGQLVLSRKELLISAGTSKDVVE